MVEIYYKPKCKACYTPELAALLNLKIYLKDHNIPYEVIEDPQKQAELAKSIKTNLYTIPSVVKSGGKVVLLTNWQELYGR